MTSTRVRDGNTIGRYESSTVAPCIVHVSHRRRHPVGCQVLVQLTGELQYDIDDQFHITSL